MCLILYTTRLFFFLKKLIQFQLLETKIFKILTQFQTLVIILSTMNSGVPPKGYEGCYTLSSVFNNLAGSTQNIFGKYFKISLCWLMEFHKPDSIHRFFLSSLSILLEYKRILSNEQKHKLRHKKHTVLNNARTNGLHEVFINHIHLYRVTAVTPSPLFLNDSIGQIMGNESFFYVQ